jgi:hypothetical protein
MKAYSLLVGSRAGRRRFSTVDEKLIRTITARHFPEGFTILHADGLWYDPATKSFRREAARQILVCTRTAQPVRRWSLEIGRALKQRELLLVEVGAAKKIVVKDPRG